MVRFGLYFETVVLHICRVDRIYREAQACGEFNRLVQGLHENFPLMKFKDPFMRSVSKNVLEPKIYIEVSSILCIMGEAIMDF